jgi:hypothetical protein
MCCCAGLDWDLAPTLRWGGHDYLYFNSLGVIGRSGRGSVLAFRRRS